MPSPCVALCAACRGPALRRLFVPTIRTRALSIGPRGPFVQTRPSSDSSFDDDFEDSRPDGPSPSSTATAVAEFNAEMAGIFGAPLDGDEPRATPLPTAPRRSPRMSIEQARAATQALIDQQVALRDGGFVGAGSVDSIHPRTSRHEAVAGGDGSAIAGAGGRGGVHVHVHYHIDGAASAGRVEVTTHSHVHVHVHERGE